MNGYGVLRGVGVGPGDPELMTLKSAALLRASTTIAYVVDEQGESYARKIAAGFFPVSVHEVPLFFSMSPDRSRRLAARAEAVRQVMDLLAAGDDVTFITEGDPLLYSTFQYLLSGISPQVTVEICPGISALNASAAEASFPLLTEDERMVVATLTPESIQLLPEWLKSFDVLVLFKVHRHMADLATALDEAQFQGKTVLVQRASLAGQAMVTDLADWDRSPLPYFTIALIRSVDGK